mmetsp:Transcript_47820/g.83725  ORF Transcript_47820/g.83725 Transcript_47820/m.83725 type:complete len:612 (-) Transcript_47820:2294-4129(-)
MGNGALNSPHGGGQLVRKDFEKLEKMCRNSYFREHFDDYKVTFHKAIDSDAIDMIELLIPAGNSKKLQPLHIACRLAKLESAELLISAGFSCFLVDEKGRTPLHLCCTSRSIDAGLCATLLAVAGKKALTIRDNEGLTPLHLAAAQNNLHVIQALMNNGADVSITTAAGHTPYQVATDNRNYEALNLLKELVSNKSKQLSNKKSHKGKNSGYEVQVVAPAKQETQADMDRIMQVWEKFFENAFKRMGIDPEDLEDEYPAPPVNNKNTNKSNNYQQSKPQYDNWTDEDYYGDLNQYVNPAVASSKKSKKHDPKRHESKDFGDGYPDYSSKTHLGSTKAAYYDDSAYDQSTYDTQYNDYYDYNYTNNYQHYPYTASDGGLYQGSLDPIQDAQRVVDWFEWIVFYEENSNPEEEGAYYVLNKSTGDTAWLADYIASFQRSTLLPCDDWHDYELHMSYPLPTTLLETITRGWMTYYEAAESACRWINLPTKSIEALLPVGIGEHAQVLLDLGLTVCDSDCRYYSADQSCALAWVLVVGLGDPADAFYDSKTDTEIAPDPVYYYRNRISGETSWQPPGNWDDLVTSWDGWTLCCSEDNGDDLYWHDFESGESAWVE